MEKTTITTNSMAVFNSTLNKVAKKAEKLGFPAPVVVSVTEKARKVDFGDTMEKYWEVEVNYEIPVVNGWMVIGNRENVNGLVILNTMDSTTDLSSYNKSNTMACEHCGTNHNRKKTVLIKNVGTGNVIEVGIACLKDFVPVSLKNLWYYNELIEDSEEKFWTTETLHCIDTVSVMTVTAAVVRNYGFTSKSKAEELMTWSTSMIVADYFFGKKEVSFEITEDDKKMAETVIAYFNGLNINDHSSNSYMVNLIKLFNSTYIDKKHFGYACSAIAAFNKATEKKIESNSNHVGNVGDKIKNVTVKMVSRKITEGYYGTVKVLTLMDESGNVYVAFYSGKEGYEYEGKTVKMAGTIDKHTEFNKTKQTVIKRISLKEF